MAPNSAAPASPPWFAANCDASPRDIVSAIFAELDGFSTTLFDDQTLLVIKSRVDKIRVFMKVFFLSLAVAALVPCLAQEYRATLVGSVTDPTGAAAANAPVQAPSTPRRV